MNITIPLPPEYELMSLVSHAATGAMFPTSKGLAYQNRVQQEARKVLGDSEPLCCELELIIAIYNRVHILDMLQLTIDALCGIAWAEKARLVEWHIETKHDSGKARITVSALEVSEWDKPKEIIKHREAMKRE